MTKTIDTTGTERFSPAVGEKHDHRRRLRPMELVKALFQARPEREVELFVRERGGVLNDAIEREIGRYLSGRSGFNG